MSMSQQQEKHIRAQLEAAFPGFPGTSENNGWDDVWRIYNTFDEPLDWKLVELCDHTTLERRWLWMRKS